MPVNFASQDFLEHIDATNLSISNETVNSGEWRDSLQRLMQINTPEAVPVTTASPASEQESEEAVRRSRHSSAHRRHKKRAKEERAKRELFTPPVVIEHEKPTVLLSWAKPESLQLLPLQYRIRYHHDIVDRKRNHHKAKQSKVRLSCSFPMDSYVMIFCFPLQIHEIITEDEEVEIRMKSTLTYRFSIEAKPVHEGFWGEALIFSIHMDSSEHSS
jgi:hypothetical protein